MFNLNQYIIDNPDSCQRLSCGDTLFTVYNCRLEARFSDIWSHNNYIIYVAEGRKIWHTPQGSYDLQAGSCVFIRRGAAIIEQFLTTEFCFYLFFVSDEFICDVISTKSSALHPTGKKFHPVISIESSDAVHLFFQSLLPYFKAPQLADQSLLQLKFRELILILADNNNNQQIISYFHNLLHNPRIASLQTVMDDNFCFNLKMEDFARLSYRSLSSFKRDFIQLYKTTPGKWLMEKRLDHSKHLLTVAGRSVTEAAFDSGFESVSHFSRAFRKRFGRPPSSAAKHSHFEPGSQVDGR